MIEIGSDCLSSWELSVDLLMVLLCLALAVAFSVRAFHHFGRGRKWLAACMMAGVMVSGATGALWGIIAALGMPPFFMRIGRSPICNKEDVPATPHLTKGPISAGLLPSRSMHSPIDDRI
jgi:hypothetical protein